MQTGSNLTAQRDDHQGSPPTSDEYAWAFEPDLYRAYWEASVDGLFAVRVTADGQFCCNGLNPALEAATGLESKNTAGKPPEDYLPARTAAFLVELYRGCLTSGAPAGRTEALDFPAGHRVCSVSVVPVRGPGGRIELLLGRAHDVTELWQMRTELSELAERLLDVQEEERRRIAIELHDSTSQHLVGVQLQLAALRDKLLAKDAAAVMNNALEEALKDIRTLSFQLIPRRLAQERLTRTLQDFTRGLARRTGMSIELVLEGKLDGLVYEVQRPLFRVVQEALINAHRHGRARCAVVELSLDESGVRLSITDDGRPVTLPIARGVGISGMEVRMERFGGSLSVTPTQSGTSVLAVIPAAAMKERSEGILKFRRLRTRNS